MHLDPAKKELHLPPGLVERTDAQGRQRGVVADEQQSFVGLWIFVSLRRLFDDASPIFEQGL